MDTFILLPRLTVAVDVLFNLLFVMTVKEKEKPIMMVYVPSHLYHMVFELFKVGFAFQTLCD